MDKIKHAVANVKEKVTGHHGHEHKHEAHENSPVKDKAPHQSHPPVDAVYPADPPTHGHAHTNRDHPGAPGVTETPPVDAVYPADPPTHGHAHTSRDPPGAPGVIETPAPGVVGSGTGMPGMGPTMMPRI